MSRGSFTRASILLETCRYTAVLPIRGPGPIRVKTYGSAFSDSCRAFGSAIKGVLFDRSYVPV